MVPEAGLAASHRICGTATMTRTETEIHELLSQHGRTFAAEAGIRLDDTPAPLFQLLVLATLLSARISAGLAVRGMQALLDDGLTTVDKMAEASWEHRVKVLNESGYARYDESTSRMLGDTCAILQETYGGDLRKLREAAKQDPAQEHARLKKFKGIGDVGAAIFLREVQGIWPEVYPYADRKVLQAAERQGLPTDTDELSQLCRREDFPRLVAAIIRVDLAQG